MLNIEKSFLPNVTHGLKRPIMTEPCMGISKRISKMTYKEADACDWLLV